MIHYITPYATDGNIGRAYNEACSLVPAGDWICIRDGDTMFATPNWGRHIEQVVQKYGESYDLFGAMTNRVGINEQCLPDMFYELSLRRHHEVSRILEMGGPRVEAYSGTVAGFFMLFSKETWAKHPFIEDRKRARLFDVYFSRSIKRKAIIKSLYLIHLYRLWSNTPRTEIGHLI